MFSDLVDSVMDMFGGRKSRHSETGHNSRSTPRDMLEGLLEGDDSRQERQRRRDDDWDADEPFDADRRGRHGHRRDAHSDFD